MGRYMNRALSSWLVTHFSHTTRGHYELVFLRLNGGPKAARRSKCILL